MEESDDAKLQSWYSNLAHISTHNAYHTGQIIYIRKLQGFMGSKQRSEMRSVVSGELEVVNRQSTCSLVLGK